MTESTDITLNVQTLPTNSLRWSEDRLVLTSQSCAALIRVAPTSKLVRPHEVSPNFEDMGKPLYACDSKQHHPSKKKTDGSAEDAFCIPEVSYGRLVDSKYSPYGIGKHRGRLLAALTADRRCAIYDSTKDPDKDRWELRHVLLKCARQRLGYTLDEPISNVDAIKHLRLTSIAWTPPCFHPESRWGDTLFLTGNEAGELHFYRISWQSQELHFVLKISEEAIVMIRPGLWSEDGQLDIFLIDRRGSVYRVRCRAFLREGLLHVSADSTASSLLIDTAAQVAAMEYVQHDQFVKSLAIATPGRIRILSSLADTKEFVETAEHKLPFYGPVGGLCWSQTPQEQMHLFVFGSSGDIASLEYNVASQSLAQAVGLSKRLESFNEQLLKKHNESANEAGCKSTISFNGAALSPADLVLGVSYTVKPVNRIQYMVPSSYINHVTFVTVAEDVRPGLQALVSRFLRFPYSISLSAVTSLHKRLSIPLLSSLDEYLAQGNQAVAQEEIRYDVFAPGSIANNHRIALASGELQESTRLGVTNDLRNEYFKFVLTVDTSRTHYIGPCARQLLFRFADCVLQFVNGNEQELHALANTVRNNLRSISNGDQAAADNSCLACGLETAIDESIVTAQCSNGHIWPLCTITLRILSGVKARTCLECGRKAISIEHEVLEPGYFSDLMQACDMCFYCTGKWYNKF